ncbi:hypothetical protein E1A91_A05G175300v1 [Gossypium mustelinum]|uniref:Bromo domain-containing protein n=1 Tax=Gossypium mustelinum TaxID=34275 RepID=A0A5D2Z976_GOSMU|nr:hypothetical protein E1A91_A05G175300v1 [Gossypium mustelinum]
MGTGRWGTWEELLLGGAVLRHGTRDWNLVASELRTRTVAPFGFTPEICKAKYEDLQQRYSGCKAWFEELRKQRMAELRQALEKTEDSIGSLESKVEGLKAEKKDDSQVIYGSSQTESAIPCLKSEGIEFSSKEKCKDRLSASSFTQEAETNWPPHCQIPVAVPAEVMDVKQGDSLTSEREQISSIDKLVNTFCGGRFLSIRKRRGKRKRKDCSKNAKEGSVGESEFLGPADVANALWCKETSASSEDQNRGSSSEVIDDIMGIFSSIAKNDCTSVFRRRLDSQERGRYKKMIRQHRDFDTIRSRIASKSIMSVKELFRDMLLVANNALVFYSKNTREYKSALLLRHIVTATLQQHLKELRSKVPLHKPLAKPRSIHPSHHERLGNTANNETPVVVNSRGCKNTSNAESPPSMESSTFSAQPRNAGCGYAIQKSESPAKGRKRARAC